jgi:hypothetical protein
MEGFGHLVLTHSLFGGSIIDGGIELTVKNIVENQRVDVEIKRGEEIKEFSIKFGGYLEVDVQAGVYVGFPDNERNRDKSREIKLDYYAPKKLKISRK